MMELCVNDRVTQRPSGQDIVHAIDTAPRDAEWHINLEADNGTFIEAFARADGTFTLTSKTRKRRYDAAVPVDAAHLKTIFTKFLAGDASWRAECAWKDQDSKGSLSSPVPARDTSEPPAWAVAIVVGAIAVVVLIFSLPSAWQSAMPFGTSDYFYIGLIFLPMLVLVIVAIAAKLIDARRAATWPQAMGRIVKSGIAARHHRFAGEATTVTNAPAVEYEFTARGRTWRGSRIGIGEDSGGANLDATLARYPVGKAVPVYYDPADPSNCVIERDIPKGMGKGCAIVTAAGAVAIAGTWYLTTNASRLLEAHLPNAQAPAAVFAACFGLLLLLFFFAQRRYSRRAAGWPSVRGTIVSSGTESFEKRENGRTTTYHAPAVEFAYQVHGIDYRSRQINLGVATSGSQAYAERVAARYPEGRDVEVHYDPANPTVAALENPTGYAWLLLATAAGCFGVAVYASGIFR